MQQRLPRTRIFLSIVVVAVVVVILANSGVISWSGVKESFGKIGIQSFLVIVPRH